MYTCIHIHILVATRCGGVGGCCLRSGQPNPNPRLNRRDSTVQLKRHPLVFLSSWGRGFSIPAHAVATWPTS